MTHTQYHSIHIQQNRMFFSLFFIFYYGRYCVLGMMIGGDSGERVAKVGTEWQQHTVYKNVLLGFSLA